MKLTKAKVDGVMPGARDLVVFDDKLPGFGLKVTPAGKKVFIFQYRYPLGRAGQTKRYTIGAYCDALPPDKARDEAVQLYARVHDGEDPAAARRQAREEAQGITETVSSSGTVSELVDAYVGYIKKRNRRWADYQGLLNRHVLPRWRDRQVKSLKRSDVVGLLDQVETAVSPITADHVLRVVRAMFNWHAVRDEEFTSPVIRGMARIRPKEWARDRVLSDTEIGKLWQWMRSAPYPFGPCLMLLFITAQRREDVAQMRWDEIEGRLWTIPKERYKGKRSHTVPLTPMARAILKRVPRLGPYVFTTTGSTPVSGFSKVKRTIDVATGIRAWRYHDLRRTARTLMSRAGVRPDIAERVLGHTISGVAGIYDRHNYTGEKLTSLRELERVLRTVKSEHDNETA